MRLPALMTALSMMIAVACGGSETEPATPATAVTPAEPEPAEPTTEPTEPTTPPEPVAPKEPEPTFDHGRFVWFEHWAKDAKTSEKAQKFYGDVFGWTIRASEMGGVTAHEIVVGDTPIGMFGTPSDYKGKPTWMGYISVADVDAAVAAASANGGAVVGEAKEMPDIGKFATVKGPSGALIGVFHSPKGDQPEAQPAPGKWAWMELWVKNAKAKDPEVKFLTAVGGWSTSEMPMGKKKYTAFMNGEKARGGIDVAPKAKQAGAWVPYVMVADVDGAVKKATKAKAKVVMKPTTIENVGRMAVVTDPSGAKIGLWQALEPAGGSGAGQEGGN